MIIAIHHREFSFSERWIEFCKKNNIEYKLVNAFDSDIINQLNGCYAFIWHYHHAEFKDVMVAKKILFSLEHSGVKVFPNFNTNWHFDDKVAQKYLLESVNAPLIPSFVFYDKENALKWAESTEFPKVFKLKGGAGSSNVKLVKDFNHCKKLINKSFGNGFKQFDSLTNLKDEFKRFKENKISFKNLLGNFYKMITSTHFSKNMPKEKGYIYFQEFIPNNDSDIRVIVIANKAFALKRLVRKGDFRASGSGEILYDKNEIDERCLKIAFETNKSIKAQSIAYDFVFDNNNEPLIIEISYGFSVTPYNECQGYWDSELNWYEEKFNPQVWMLKEIIK